MVSGVQSRKIANQILNGLGFSAKAVIAATPQGIANDTWLCDDWVVRISKDPEYLEDLFTESIAAAAAFAANVPTAEPLCFHLEAQDGIPPHSVYRRIHGQSLSGVERLSDPKRFFRLYGAALRVVHAITTVNDPNHYLDDPWELDHHEILIAAQEVGLAPVVRPLLDHDPVPPTTFVHQDLHADNVLVDEHEQPIFIDWGDAGFGDAAVDFRHVPARFLAYALEGYGEFQPQLLQRIQLHVFDQFVYAQNKQKRYGIYGDSDLDSLREFLRRAL